MNRLISEKKELGPIGEFLLRFDSNTRGYHWDVSSVQSTKYTTALGLNLRSYSYIISIIWSDFKAPHVDPLHRIPKQPMEHKTVCQLPTFNITIYNSINFTIRSTISVKYCLLGNDENQQQIMPELSIVRKIL